MNSNDFFSNSVGIFPYSNVTISSNTFVSNDRGIYLDSSSTGSYIIENEFQKNDDGVMLLNASPYILSNLFNNDNLIGINITNSSVVIEQNNFSDNQIALNINGRSRNTSILNNYINSNYYGILSYNSGGRIIENEISDQILMGMYCYNSSMNITGNDISGNTYGLYCINNNNTSVLFVENNIENNDRGLLCRDRGSINASNSYFSYNNKSIFITGNVNVTASGSIFRSNTIGSYVWDSDYSIDNCSFFENTFDYFTHAGGNLTITDCEFDSSTGNVNKSYEEFIMTPYLPSEWQNDPNIIDMEIGDVNNDTFNDIIFIHRTNKPPFYWEFNLTIMLYNSTSETFNEPIIKNLGTLGWGSMSGHRILTVENIDDDWESEILIGGENITVYDWTGFDWDIPTWFPIGSSYTHGDIATGDVNNDGYIDIVSVAGGYYNYYMCVFLWNPYTFHYDTPIVLDTVASPNRVYIDDINGDDLGDIVFTYKYEDEISFINQTLSGGLAPRYDLEFQDGVGTGDIIIEDINEDDYNDIIAGGTPLAYRLYNDTTTAFDEEIPFSEEGYQDIKCYDWDNDNDKEIFGFCGSNSEIDVYDKSGLTFYLNNTFTDYSNICHFYEVGNLNSDDKCDLVGYGSFEGSILLWNSSRSTTQHGIRIKIKNDTNEPVPNARVTIVNNVDQEIVNITTDSNGQIGPITITVNKRDLTSNIYYSPFIIIASKYSGGIWYNISQNCSLTNCTKIEEITIYLGNDSDNDGLTDGYEVYMINTNATNMDTDGDGLSDGLELGVTNATKPSTTSGVFHSDLDPSNTTSPLSNDTDNDGLLDGIEDSNQNGLRESGETDPDNWDSDEDTIPDGWIDYNSDDIKDLGEYEDYNCNGVFENGSWGSGGEINPLEKDTDGGGVNDNDEINNGSNPSDSVDDVCVNYRRRSIATTHEIIIGTVDEFEVKDSWATYTFPDEQRFFSPVVISQPLSYSDSRPAHVRIKNVNLKSCEICIEEWLYYDGNLQNTHNHANEDVSILVMEEGCYVFPDGTKVEVGIVRARDNFVSRYFSQEFTNTPIVLTQSQTCIGEDPIVTRVRNVSPKKFEVKVQEEYFIEGGFAGVHKGHSYEIIGYIAIEPHPILDNGNEVELNRLYKNNGIRYKAGLKERVFNCNPDGDAPDSETDKAHENYGWNVIEYNWGKDSDITWYDDTYFSSTPLCFASTQTYYNAETVGIRYKDNNYHDITLLIEEDESKSAGCNWHPKEQIGYIAFSGKGNLIRGVRIGEMNKIRINHDVMEIELENEYNNPVVIAQPITEHGGFPAHTRIDVGSVDNNANWDTIETVGVFQIGIEEWDYLDGIHDYETVSYLVMESGSYILPDGRMAQAGKVDATMTEQYFPFPHPFTTESVVVFAQVQEWDNIDPISTRIYDVDDEGFKVVIQEEEESTTDDRTETVGWIAIEAASTNIINNNVKGRVVTSNDCWVSDTMTFGISYPDKYFQTNNEMFLAQIHSFEEDDPFDLRYEVTDFRTRRLHIQEERSSGNEVSHNVEALGYCAFERGGTLYAQKFYHTLDENSNGKDDDDYDHDGWGDSNEIFYHHTNPLLGDTDSDGFADYKEYRVSLTYESPKLCKLNPDYDGDGVGDGYDSLPTIFTYTPPEFAPKDELILTWPIVYSPDTFKVWVDIIEKAVEIETLETIRINVLSEDMADVARSMLDVDMEKIDFWEVATDDKWVRDYGPNFVLGAENKLHVLDWYYGHENDNNYNKIYSNTYGYNRVNVDMALDGGNFQTDGNSVGYTTRMTMTQNKNVWSEEGIKNTLKEKYGLRCIRVVEPLNYDVTGHLDNLVYFVSATTVIVAEYDPDDVNYELTNEVAKEFRYWGYKVIRVTNPDTVYREEDPNEPDYNYVRSYTNALFLNGFVFVPTYAESIKDSDAIAKYEGLFPGKVIPIDCSELFTCHGEVHCITMTKPKV